MKTWFKKDFSILKPNGFYNNRFFKAYPHHRATYRGKYPKSMNIYLVEMTMWRMKLIDDTILSNCILDNKTITKELPLLSSRA